MHEIPNLPFPSLNPEEHTVAAHSEPTPAVEDGDDTSSADQE
ncbi:hypothetical protein J2W83_002880 [Pseudomonas hunanensis]|uniref:Uncharacterized protein n=1 Tax=Pseudomonas hunanensis TaxID=1247546 RepID=A0ACC6K4C1_9PSED|nr:hypothetical protein [Pseudomonas sp. BP8]MDR6713277.1 hypothetical protein [Pseudomonas hunanensis]